MVQIFTRSAKARPTAVGVLGKPTRDGSLAKAAPILEFLRKIPMVQGGDRSNPRFEQSVDQARVEIESTDVDRSGPFRNDPRPRDAEAIGANAELRHQRHVTLPAVIVIARHVPGGTVVDTSGSIAEPVPDALPAAVFVCCALDLVRARGYTPKKSRRKLESSHGGTLARRFPAGTP